MEVEDPCRREFEPVREGSIQLTFADSSVSARWKVADWVSRVGAWGRPPGTWSAW